MANPDQDRITALNSANTTLGALTPTDQENRADIGDRMAYNADEARRLAGSKAFDVGGKGSPCRP